MKQLIDKSELRHRLCNGFISHDGYVDGKFRDLFVEAGYEWVFDADSDFNKIMNIVVEIIESIPIENI